MQQQTTLQMWSLPLQSVGLDRGIYTDNDHKAGSLKAWDCGAPQRGS